MCPGRSLIRGYVRKNENVYTYVLYVTKKLIYEIGWLQNRVVIICYVLPSYAVGFKQMWSENKKNKTKNVVWATLSKTSCRVNGRSKFERRRFLR